MMSAVIQKETLVFFLSVAHGIGLACLYDLLRALRRAFRHGIAAVSAEDFLFWLVAGFLTFCLAFSNTDGVIRGYVAVGIAIGVILYHQTVSAWVVKGCFMLFIAIKHLFFIIFRMLRTGIGKIRKILGWPARLLSIPLQKICIKLKKTIEIRKKKGYNVTKAIHHKGEIKGQRGKKHGKKKKEKAQP